MYWAFLSGQREKAIRQACAAVGQRKAHDDVENSLQITASDGTGTDERVYYQ